MEVTADDLGGLLRAATAAHRRMQVSASRVTDDDCRGPSLLPGWSRGHVLTHWARNADGQSRMLLAAMHGEIAEQYPGGDERRESEIEAGANRPARLILSDVRTATGQVEDVWRRMPPDAWSRPTAARIGLRPAWMSVWARWRETEIHHVDLNIGYTHSSWPAEFVDLMLPRVMPTLATRLTEEITVQAETTDRDPLATATTADTTGDPLIVRGPASAILCWLLGRVSAAAADLEVTRCGQPWRLPRLRAWA
jgi:maleylpyruvate isomerase